MSYRMVWLFALSIMMISVFGFTTAGYQFASFVTWRPDGTMLAVFDYREGSVQIVDAESGAILNILPVMEIGAPPVWSHDGQKLAISVRGGIEIIDQPWSENDFEVQTYEYYIQGRLNLVTSPKSLQWEPNSSAKLAFMDGGTITFLEIEALNEIAQITDESWSNITQIIWYDPNYILSANLNREVSRVNIQISRVENAFYGPNLTIGINSAASIDMSPDHQSAVIGYADGLIHVWHDVESDEFVDQTADLEFYQHQYLSSERISWVDWNPVYNVVATADQHGKIIVWNPYTGDIYDIIDMGDGVEIMQIEWSPDGTRLAYTDLDSELKFFPVPEEAILSEQSTPEETNTPNP